LTDDIVLRGDRQWILALSAAAANIADSELTFSATAQSL